MAKIANITRKIVIINQLGIFDATLSDISCSLILFKATELLSYRIIQENNYSYKYHLILCQQLLKFNF